MKIAVAALAALLLAGPVPAPRIYLPAHHDESYGQWLDLGVEPLFLAIRDEMPQTKTIAPLYRTPICLSAVPHHE